MKVGNLPIVEIVMDTRSAPVQAILADFSAELESKLALGRYKDGVVDAGCAMPMDKAPMPDCGAENLPPLAAKQKSDDLEQNKKAPVTLPAAPHIAPLQLLMAQTQAAGQSRPGEEMVETSQAEDMAFKTTATRERGAVVTSMEKSSVGSPHASAPARTQTPGDDAVFTLSADQQHAVSMVNKSIDLTGERPPHPSLPESSIPQQMGEGGHIHQGSPLPAELTAISRPVSSITHTPPEPSYLLRQELGSPAWQSSLGQQISLFTKNGIHNAQLHLHPQELGTIKVNLRVNNEQVHLHFFTENHQVHAAMEAVMPHLRTMLAESGLHLAQSSVGTDSAFSDGFFSQTGQKEQHSDNNDTRHTDMAPLQEESPEIPIKLVDYSRGINILV